MVEAILSKAAEIRRVLIVAKTYPELSTKHGETVCTAAVDESGNPVRLYPIPFRQLSQRFDRYQWLCASIRKNPHDLRPESYRVLADSIVLGEKIPPTPDEWGIRADAVLKSPSWQFTSMSEILKAQAATGLSLAFIRPQSVTAVSLKKRADEDASSFRAKADALKAQNLADRRQRDLFGNPLPPLIKHLEYIETRVSLDWRCADTDCKGHSMQILDWEICELARREGLEAARTKVEQLFDSNRYKSALILGNFHLFPGSFAVIGIWYPPLNPGLFNS